MLGFHTAEMSMHAVHTQGIRALCPVSDGSKIMRYGWLSWAHVLIQTRTRANVDVIVADDQSLPPGLVHTICLPLPLERSLGKLF